MKKIRILLLLAVVSALTATAQSDEKVMHAMADTEWNKGRITFANGSTMQGSIRYNPKVGMLSFRHETDQETNEESIYTPNNVAGFEFWDEGVSKQRVYYTLSYVNPKTKIEGPAFFEVLYEFKTFALLSRIHPMELKTRSNPGSMGPNGEMGPSGPVTEFVVQMETLYFADHDGNILPYLKIKSRTDRKRSRGDLVGITSLAKYTQPYYRKLVEYSENENLQFDSKDDFLLIMQYYQKLLAE